jgi:transposase-like protein
MAQRRVEMTFRPTFAQLEIIEQYGNAHMPLEAIAAALDIHPDTLRKWIARLASTRSVPRYAPPPPRPVAPPPAPISPRVIADRVFESGR